MECPARDGVAGQKKEEGCGAAAAGAHQIDPFLIEALQNPRHRLAVLRMELDIQRFMQNPGQNQFEFQHFPTSYLRCAAHRVAQYYGLQTMSLDNLSDGLVSRILAIKTQDSRFPPIYLSEIPVKQPETDSIVKVKIAICTRPNKASSGDTNELGRKVSPARTMEERMKEYDKAWARIFSASSGLEVESLCMITPDEKSTCENPDEQEYCRTWIEENERACIKDGASRVAIFRDREKDRHDPDYDWSYNRSRVCVKNLPKYVNEDRIRDFFSQKGELTDVKLMRTRDGKSRQFAFVGFRSESEAKEAIDYFDKSYMDTCRITCEVARKVGDPDIPHPWSSHSKTKGGSLDENNKDRSGLKVEKQGSSNVKVKNHKDTKNKDPHLQEFLQVMQPRVKSKIWANDTLGEANLVDQGGKTDDEEQPPKVKKKQSAKKHQSELVRDASVEASPISQSDEVAGDESTYLDYFKSRVKKNWSDSESDDEDTDHGNAGNNNRESKKMAGKGDLLDGSDGRNLDKENSTVPSDDHDSQALDTNRLYVRNLSYTTDEDELMELFSQYGDVSQVHIVVDKVTKCSKGFAFVHYKLPESAARALEELDHSIFQGRLLHVIPAKAQIVSIDHRSDHSAIQDNKSFKQKRKEQRKASETSGDTRAWNSLITHPNTVVENIARKHGISKSELLDQEANDLAVRVALGETYVISETKRALSNAGVNINALEESVSKRGGSTERSNKIILAKNLPYSTCERDLADMFGKFGSVDKIILPPTRVLALVIFQKLLKLSST